MNPMLTNMPNNNLPPEIMQRIQQIKQMKSQLQNNTQVINEVKKMCNGQSFEQYAKFLCKQYNIDPNELIKALQ